MQVRERIRINGKPISPELFTKHFWSLYHQLEEFKVLWLEGWRGPVSLEQGVWGLGGRGVGLRPLTRSCVQDGDHTSMPSYFRFLTLMAFHVFLQEKVSVFPDSVSESSGNTT